MRQEVSMINQLTSRSEVVCFFSPVDVGKGSDFLSHEKPVRKLWCFQNRIMFLSRVVWETDRKSEES